MNCKILLLTFIEMTDITLSFTNYSLGRKKKKELLGL